MAELTVGQIAGLIAGGFVIASRLFPDGLAFIVSSLLRDKNSAATWTHASAALQKSLWPVVLRTDVVYGHAVQSSILWIHRLLTVTTILLGVAAIVTPLGLYSVLLPGHYMTPQFVYSTDTSSFGYGTSAPSNYSWARQCGAGLLTEPPLPCPFSDTVTVVRTLPNGTEFIDFPYGYNMSIPDIIQQTYSSGTKHATTVSNYFDIRYRRTAVTQDDFYMNNSAFLTPANRGIESLIQENAYVAVEGLVVDATTGGVGFRNHTTPVQLSHGARWVEDLLFVEPETVCVDTNLTLDYTISNNQSSTTSGLYFTDRGGFANLNQTYPSLDISDPQSMPNLYERAYRAAWLHNAWAAVYLNLTNPHNGTQGAFAYMKSEVGQKILFSSSLGGANSISGVDALEITQTFGGYIKPATDPDNPSLTDNPWAIGPSNWSDINISCAGAGNDDYANISNILVVCGQMRGVPQRIDGGGSKMIYERGSVWSQKIFACASAAKATVKSVTFLHNTTDMTLKGLDVVDISDKVYSDDASMPLWGVENTGDAYRTRDINLIWGIVDDSYASNPNVSTIRKASLYLPGFLGGAGSTLGTSYGDWQNFPGSDFSVAALSSVYDVSTASSGTSLGLSQTKTGVDYTGRVSLAMWSRWQNLTARADLASLIPNLVFTDVAASMVVGTKGVLGSGNAGLDPVVISVQPTVLTVRYRLLYGIPAFLVAALLLLLAVGIAVSAFIPKSGRHRGVSRLRYHIQGLASGRIYTMNENTNAVDSTTQAKVWSKTYGETEVLLPEKFVEREGEIVRPDEKSIIPQIRQDPI